MQVSFLEPLISPTPIAWGKQAVEKLHWLLSDHAYCERKAAAFAIGLLQKYGHFYKDHMPLSKLVREEMRHYELVLRILETNNLALIRLPACGYARNLRSAVVEDEPLRHIRMLLIAAIIEARSCERFEVLSECLRGVDNKLATFYSKLALAEKRHHLLYVEMACELMSESLVLENLQLLSELEQGWLEQNISTSSMHSGILIKEN